MVGDGRSRAECCLKIREYCGRENPPDAAAINGKDTEVPISRPILQDTADRNRSGRAGEDGQFVGHWESLFSWEAWPPDQTPVSSQASNQNSHSAAQGMIVSAIE